MTEEERMLAGLPYQAWKDGLPEKRIQSKHRFAAFNACPPEDTERQKELLRELFGKIGENIEIFPPVYCDYGKNIEIGENFFASYNFTVIDVAKVKIGDNVMIAANTTISSAGHPIHWEPRNAGYEYGIEVTIGNNVWIGANCMVNPGVHIGNNVVIGSGSVVTKDIPDNVVAVGNPCHVMRVITDEDKQYYFKKRRFDEVEDN